MGRSLPPLPFGPLDSLRRLGTLSRVPSLAPSPIPQAMWAHARQAPRTCAAWAAQGCVPCGSTPLRLGQRAREQGAQPAGGLGVPHAPARPSPALRGPLGWAALGHPAHDLVTPSAQPAGGLGVPSTGLPSVLRGPWLPGWSGPRLDVRTSPPSGPGGEDPGEVEGVDGGVGGGAVSRGALLSWVCVAGCEPRCLGGWRGIRLEVGTSLLRLVGWVIPSVGGGFRGAGF